MFDKENILYEDENLIVCYKPPGMPVQTRKFGQMDLESAVRNYLCKSGKTPNPYVAVIHRLDQPVEGILVFAKDKKTAAELEKNITGSGFMKCYLAVTEGTWEQEEGTLTDFLSKDGRTNKSQVVKDEKTGKKAVLCYQVLETMQQKQLIKVQLQTGRHHQIRVQLSHRGHAILGDRKYDAKESAKEGNGAISLCAYMLEFVHPVKKEKMQFQIVPNGKDFKEFTYCAHK